MIDATRASPPQKTQKGKDGASHIRPKLRKKKPKQPTKIPPSNPSTSSVENNNRDNDLDSLLESTRQRLTNCTVQSPTTTTPEVEVVSSTDSSILRSGKYASETSSKNVNIDSNPPDSIPDKNKSDEGDNTSNKKTDKHCMVKELVVERKNISSYTMELPASQDVEGYTPNTTLKHKPIDPPSQTSNHSQSTTHDSKIRTVSELIRQRELLSKNISQLGLDPKEQQLLEKGEGDHAKEVEADVTFSYMTNEEYQETLIENHQDKENAKEEQPKSQVPFIGRFIFDGADEDGADKDGDGDDDSDFFDTQEDEEVEESFPAAEPRSFMKLWTALSSWVTPQSIALLHHWDTCYSPNDESPLQNSFDQSDIGVSRCTGLMTLLKMHIQPCIKEIQKQHHHDAADRERIHFTLVQEKRLSHLVRSFDFSLSMPKLEGKLWRAMTAVMIGVVLNGIVDDDYYSIVPPSVRDVDITVEEYCYLVKKALNCFEKGSE